LATFSKKIALHEAQRLCHCIRTTSAQADPMNEKPGASCSAALFRFFLSEKFGTMRLQFSKLFFSAVVK